MTDFRADAFSRRHLLIGGATFAALGVIATRRSSAAVTLGAAAPTFSLASSTGPTISLADQKGKIVILEWTNHECPYVRKHYETSNMQNLQREATGQGVVWLTVISSAPGTQGYVSAGEANELTKTRKAAPTAVLFDPTGVVIEDSIGLFSFTSMSGTGAMGTPSVSKVYTLAPGFLVGAQMLFSAAGYDPLTGWWRTNCEVKTL